MNRLLVSTAMFLLVWYGNISSADKSPDDALVAAEAKFNKLASSPGASPRMKASLVYPAKEEGRTWLSAVKAPGWEVFHARDVAGTFNIRAVLENSSPAYRKMAVIVRFRQMVPPAGVSGADRAYGERNWEKVVEGRATYFLQPQAQVDTTSFLVDKMAGRIASTVLWGPNWRMYERAYELEVVLLP